MNMKQRPVPQPRSQHCEAVIVSQIKSNRYTKPQKKEGWKFKYRFVFAVVVILM